MFILFVLYRFILTTLGAEQLVLWSIVLATASASRIGELGLGASVTRFVAKYLATGEAQVSNIVVQTAFLSIGVFLFFMLVLAYPFFLILFEHLFSAETLLQSVALLPVALISLWLAASASVFQSGLDGCQRYDLRAGLVVGAQLVFFASALLLMPYYGLLGLAYAQILQGIILIVGGWLILRGLMTGLPVVPYQWNKNIFREMLGYGLQFQLGSIAMLLFDPLTKLLLGKYSTLSTVAYYEMANQFVGKVRQLIVSANQVLVPAVAELNEKTSNKLSNLYKKNLRLLFFIVFPLYTLVAAWSGIVSEIWIGNYQETFVVLVIVLSIAWSINTFSVPAYFFNLGTGHITWNTLAHVAMGITNLSLGYILGEIYGTTGVVVGFSSALIIGSLLLISTFHIKNKLSFALFFPKESYGLVLGGILVVLLNCSVYQQLLGYSMLERFVICMLIPLLFMSPVIWNHPMRKTLLDKLWDYRHLK
jgi:O-antigen/teichoic acid export membrane protein